MNCGIQVDFLSLEKYPQIFEVDLCEKVNIQTFTPEWLINRIVLLTIDIQR